MWQRQLNKQTKKPVENKKTETRQLTKEQLEEFEFPTIKNDLRKLEEVLKFAEKTYKVYGVCKMGYEIGKWINTNLHIEPHTQLLILSAAIIQYLYEYTIPLVAIT